MRRSGRRRSVCLPAYLLPKRSKPAKERVCLRRWHDRKSSPCPEKTLMAVLFFCSTHFWEGTVCELSFSSKDPRRF